MSSEKNLLSRMRGYVNTKIAQISARASQTDVDTLTSQLNAAVAAVTVDSEVVLARNGFTTLGTRLNNGMANLTASKNLFDKKALTFGYTLNTSTGANEALSTHTVTDYIAVTPGATYTAKYLYRICFYDSNKTFQYNRLFPTDNNVFTVPENRPWMRVSTEIANIHDQVVCAGSDVQPNETAISKLSPTLYGAVVDSINRNGYIADCMDELNDPFVKTKIKLIGDSITQGVGGTGYADDGALFDATHRFNDNGYCWANLLKTYIAAKYNRDFHVLVDNPHITYSVAKKIGDKPETINGTEMIFSNTTTTDKASFTIYGTHFSVYYTKGPARGKFSLYVDGSLNQTVDTYAASASYENHVDITGLTDAAHTIEIRETNTKNASASANEFHIEGFVIPKKATVVNYGISGITSFWFAGYRDYFEADDTITLIMIGANDRGYSNPTLVGFETRLRSIIHNAWNVGSKPILMSSNPVSYANDSAEGNNFGMAEVDAVIKKVARHYGMNYISNYDGFLRYMEAHAKTITDVTAEGLHPNDLGYAVMFMNILRNLGLPIARAADNKYPLIEA